MRSVTKSSQTSLLLNGAAILVVVASFGVALRSSLVGEQLAPCKERYASGTRLSLEADGTLLSVEQMQGELANTDWNLMSAAQVVNVKSGPSQSALELDLARTPSVSAQKSGERVGIGFDWSPQSFSRQQAACLVYSVYVPRGFTFGEGGRLPGLRGEAAEGESGAHAPFSTRYTWSGSGELDVYAQLAGVNEGHSLGGKQGTFVLQPGKWTELEQEVVLNDPGKGNGILRVWQNGSLVYEKKTVVFRSKATVTLTGVLAEAVAGATPKGAKREAQTVRLSPFELRWN